MNDDRHGSHTVFSIHLHVAWMNQYRPKMLPGMVAERVREMVREECRRQRVGILRPSSLKGRLPRGSLLRLKPASAGTDSAQAEIAGLGRPPKPLS